MTMKPSPKKPIQPGDIVRLDFIDHCEGGNGDALEFAVFGIVRKVSPKIIQVGCWVYSDGFDREDRNETTFDIVRKAITRTTVYK